MDSIQHSCVQKGRSNKLFIWDTDRNNISKQHTPLTYKKRLPHRDTPSVYYLSISHIKTLLKKYAFTFVHSSHLADGVEWFTIVSAYIFVLCSEIREYEESVHTTCRLTCYLLELLLLVLHRHVLVFDQALQQVSDGSLGHTQLLLLKLLGTDLSAEGVDGHGGPYTTTTWVGYLEEERIVTLNTPRSTFFKGKLSDMT